MIRFRQTFGAHAGRSFEFDQEVVRFGRQPGCEVAFDAQADLDASGWHAELRREGQAYFVVDVGSRNGTWVNGKRVQRAGLAMGDEVEFGHGGPRIQIDDISANGARPDAVAAGPQIDPRAPTVVAEVGAPTTAPPPQLDSAPPSEPPAPAREEPALGISPSAETARSDTEPERRFGQKTVAMMIQSAVAHDAANRNATGLKIAVLALAVLLVLVVAALVGLVWMMSSSNSPLGR